MTYEKCLADVLHTQASAYLPVNRTHIGPILFLSEILVLPPAGPNKTTCSALLSGILSNHFNSVSFSQKKRAFFVLGGTACVSCLLLRERRRRRLHCV